MLLTPNGCEKFVVGGLTSDGTELGREAFDAGLIQNPIPPHGLSQHTMQN